MSFTSANLKAFFIHVLISAVIVCVVLSLIKNFYYPNFLFASVGASRLFQLIFFVDIILGPVLTLIVFKPGKKGLFLDITVIATVQIAAMAYGVYSLHAGRPAYISFVVDRFEVVQANKVSTKNRFDKLQFNERYLTCRLVHAALPEDVELRNDFMFERMSGGPELSESAHLYQPISSAKSIILNKAVQISNLDADTKQQLVANLKTIKEPISNFGVLPITGSKADFTALINLDSGKIVRVVRFDPWIIFK